MEGRRAPQGLTAEDRLAFGLTATHLSYLVVGSLAGYATIASGLPGFLKFPLGLLFIGSGALLAWGHLGRRPLDTWAWLAVRYYLRARRSPAPPPPGGAGAIAAETDEPRDKNGAASAVAVGPTGAVMLALPSRPAIVERETELGSAEPGERAPKSAVPDPEPEARILTLPSPFPQVADGTTEYRVDVEPETGAGLAIAAPVFLAATQRIAFFSLKGGVGKTTLATEVAAHLARRGRFRARPDAMPEPLRVALLDLDLGSANVSMKVGLTHPTLWDLVLDPDPDASRIEECLVLHQESGLRVLLGPPRAIAAGETRALAIQRLAQVLSHLDDEGFHFVFLDLSSEVDELTTYALEAAQQVYYVMTPTASGVQDTYRGVETLRRLGHKRKLRFVLNQAHSGFNPDEILADLGGFLAASVPRDEVFSVAENEHEPACLVGAGAGAEAIARLASAIYPSLEPVVQRAGWWRRLRHRIG